MLSPRLGEPLTAEPVNAFAYVSRLIIRGVRDTESATAAMEQFHVQVMAHQ
jgi:hypothetical protein